MGHTMKILFTCLFALLFTSLLLLFGAAGHAQNYGNIDARFVIGNPDYSAKKPAVPMPLELWRGNAGADTTTVGAGWQALAASRAVYASGTVNGYNTAIGGNAAPVMVPHSGVIDTHYFGFTGSYNTCVGLNSCQFAVDVYSSTGIGVGALGAQLTPRSNGVFNNALGTFALAGLGDIHGPGLGTPGGGQYASANDCFGSACGQAITTGFGNVGMGLSAINFIRQGFYNVCMGPSACLGNSYYNGAITGTTTNASTTISGLSANPTTAGWTAGMRITNAYGNLPEGTTIVSLAPTSVVVSKPAVGAQTSLMMVRATDGNSPTGVSDGYQNTAMGVNALEFIQNGQYNVGIGAYAGSDINNGSFNTLIGGGAGHSVTDGTRNTYIGNGVGDQTTTGSRNILIGTSNNCQVTAPWAVDQFAICNSSGTTPAISTSLVSGAVNLSVAGDVTSESGVFTWDVLKGTPVNSSTCHTGSVILDVNAIYVCVGLGGTSNWKKATLVTY